VHQTIINTFQQHRRRYGVRRLVVELKAKGINNMPCLKPTAHFSTLAFCNRLIPPQNQKELKSTPHSLADNVYFTILAKI
jgi:hypothetical protein